MIARFCIIRAIGGLAACLPARPFTRNGPLYDLRGFHDASWMLGNNILDYLQQTHLHHPPRGKAMLQRNSLEDK